MTNCWCFIDDRKRVDIPQMTSSSCYPRVLLCWSRDHLARKFTRRRGLLWDHGCFLWFVEQLWRMKLNEIWKAYVLSKCFNIKDASSGQFRGRRSFFLSFATHWNTGYLPWHLRHIQVRWYFCREACGMLICLAQSDQQIHKIRFWSIHSLNLKETPALSFQPIGNVCCVLATCTLNANLYPRV